MSRGTSTSRLRAFSLLEFLIVLALLVTIGAVVVSSARAQRISTDRADLVARLEASIDTARAEARRLGAPVEIVIRPVRDDESVLVIQPLDIAELHGDRDETGLFESLEPASIPMSPTERDTPHEQQPEDEQPTLVWVLPTGRVIVPEPTALETLGARYELAVSPLSGAVELTEIVEETGSGEDAAREEPEA